MRSPRILPVIGAAALALAACSGNTTPQADTTASSDDTQVPSRELVLNVYAAASLTETFEELESSYEAPTPTWTCASTSPGRRTWSPNSARGPTSMSWPPRTSPP